MRVLTVAEMQQVDRRAIEEVGVPGLVLMENAAIGVTDALGRSFPDARRIVVLAGPGNNGGDGFAVARQLDARNYDVRTLGLEGRLSGDAAVQREICRRQQLKLDELEASALVEAALETARAADLVVDALFGTGLSRPLGGELAALCPALRDSGVPVLAVDLPSGLAGDSARPIGPHLTADLTVTFAAPQPAHVLAPACDAVGELVVADLGVTPALVEESPCGLEILLVDELRGTLPRRSPEAHKGVFGHTLLVAGGAGTAGAAILAARAAVRSGGGLVTVATRWENVATVESGSLESMTLGLDGDIGGLSATATEALLAASAGKAALAIGPGLGTADGTRAAVRRIVGESTVPMVLDADAINAFEGEPGLLRRRHAGAVLTPHPGELARLFGATSAEVVDDRLAWARRAAEETGCVVLLKGRRSLTASPDGHVTINSTGNAGMATGGSGDVLTGVVTALLGQGYTLHNAGALGALVHGLAGDLAAADRGMTGMAAGDLVDYLPDAFQRFSE